MRSTILTLLLVAVLVFAVVSIPAQASIYCKYAAYNPGFAIACFWEIMMDYWDPLDWGDGDADDYGSGNVIQLEVEFQYCGDITFTEIIPRAG